MPKQKVVNVSDRFEAMATTDINVGAQACCDDGIVGRVTQIVVDPMSQRVTCLVVREEKWPRAKYLVPIKWVAEATDGLIRLRCTRDELTTLESFAEINAYRKKYPPMSR